MTSLTQRDASPRRRMAGVDRRALILEAARAAFADAGYDRTSLEAVGARAGVSKALIYEHFPSKRELHREMLEAHVRELVDRINRALESAGPGEPRMRAGVEAFFSYVEERRGTSSILLRNTGDPDVALWLARLRAQVAAAIVALMTEEARALAPEDPELPMRVEMSAQQLVGAMQSLADWWESHPGISRERVVEGAMEFAWLGLDRLSRGERWEEH